MEVHGEGAGVLSLGPDNLVHRAADALFREAGVSPPDFSLTCHNAIPLERGLGSSAAAVVGGLLAANALCDEPLSPQDLLRLAARLEGHPDNAAAALFGGCQIVAQDGDALLCASVALPSGLRAVLFIPDEAMNTAQARAVLPPVVSRQDAAFNAARTALLVNALAEGRLEHLRTATQDRMHQPQREVLFPAMRLIFSAALNAGALGVFLSGAGVHGAGTGQHPRDDHRLRDGGRGGEGWRAWRHPRGRPEPSRRARGAGGVTRAPTSDA